MLHEAGQLGQAEDALAGQVADVRDAREGQQMVLADRPERDGPGQDEFVVALVVGERGQLQRLGIEQFRVGPRHPGRCFPQSGPVNIDPQGGEEVRGGVLRRRQVDAARIAGYVQLRPGGQHGAGCLLPGRPRQLRRIDGQFLRHDVSAPCSSSDASAAAYRDAAMPRPRIKDRMQPARAKARDQALDQGQVHAADEVAVLGGQLVERAVAQPDGAIFVLAGLESVAAQGVRCGLAGSFTAGIGGPAALSQAGTELLSGVVQCGPACGTPVGFDRHREQAGRQLVLPGWHGDRELVSGTGIHLGRAARPGTSPARRPLVGGAQQAQSDQLVQVIRGQRPADPCCGRCRVPPYRLGAPGHELVQAAPHRIVEAAHRGQA